MEISPSPNQLYCGFKKDVSYSRVLQKGLRLFLRIINYIMANLIGRTMGVRVNLVASYLIGIFFLIFTTENYYICHFVH